VNALRGFLYSHGEIKNIDTEIFDTSIDILLKLMYNDIISIYILICRSKRQSVLEEQGVDYGDKLQQIMEINDRSRYE